MCQICMWFQYILHAWQDDDCVKILRQCKEAILARDAGGKVIIIEVVVGIGSKEIVPKEMQILFDVFMMYVDGIEREEHEWMKIFLEAGFSDYKITPVLGARSIIEGYPWCFWRCRCASLRGTYSSSVALRHARVHVEAIIFCFSVVICAIVYCALWDGTTHACRGLSLGHIGSPDFHFYIHHNKRKRKPKSYKAVCSAKLIFIAHTLFCLLTKCSCAFICSSDNKWYQSEHRRSVMVMSG